MNPEQLLKKRLRPVRARMYWSHILQTACVGLLWTSLFTCGLTVVRLLGWQIDVAMLALVPVVGVISGAAWGAVGMPTWKSVAMRVDRSYGLKDRTLTALEFCQRTCESHFYRLQVEDAVRQLNRVAPNRVVGRLVPANCFYACVSLVMALVLLCLPMSQKPVTARPKSSEAQFVDLANQLEQTMLDPLRDGLRLEAKLPVDDRDQVEQFLRHLEQGIQTIKLPAADTRQTLASLSEIQAELAKTTAMLDSTLIDARMKELGQIMDTADATKQLATALKEMDYKSAAEAWDAFAPTELDKPSQRSMASAAQELADKMDEAQLDPLARATRELGEALQHTAQNPETVARQKAAASQLGQLSRQMAARQAIAAKLASQKVRLDEAKGVARSGGEHSDRSRTPRQTWGRGPAPDSLAGDNPQRLDTQRQRTTIQGMAGQGPSQRDLVQSTEAAPAEDLEYNQRYQEFRRAAESVLEQEALPMGHRQTIRRYFEAIRPRE